jgi:exosome complex RNA-binding protein Rrp42 (RNase PH superfamily)
MSMYFSLSDTEIKYTTQGCECGVRRDGRGLIDYRTLQLENNILPHVNGSSRVLLSESMDVICSIKMDIIECLKDYPDKGVLMISADISPSCGIKIDEKKRVEMSSRVSERLQSILLGSSAINLNDLCIISGKYCWILHIDLIINQLDGDPLDVCSVAAYIALQSTRIPKIDTIIGESGRPDDFQVCGDLASSKALQINHIPIYITVVKIGNSFIMDATSAEHASADCAFTVAIDENGNICGMFKLHGHTSLAIPELSQMLEVRIYYYIYFILTLSHLLCMENL